MTASGEARVTPGGLSKDGVGRLGNALSGYVSRGEVPGLVALVSRGEPHLEELGTTAYADPETGAIGNLLTERLIGSPAPPAFRDFWRLACRSLGP